MTCVEDTSVNEAARLPNFTLLAPPRYVPVIVTELPVIPQVGVIDPIDGGVDIPNTHAAPMESSLGPPISAVLPSPDNATLNPWLAMGPVTPVPTSFDPCWDQVDPERVNTHAAPMPPMLSLSPAPPISAVLPSADIPTPEPW